MRDGAGAGARYRAGRASREGGREAGRQAGQNRGSIPFTVPVSVNTKDSPFHPHLRHCTVEYRY